MQDDFLLPYLSVDEAMMAAANLKLGRGFSHHSRRQVVGGHTVSFLFTFICLLSTIFRALLSRRHCIGGFCRPTSLCVQLYICTCAHHLHLCTSIHHAGPTYEYIHCTGQIYTLSHAICPANELEY